MTHFLVLVAAAGLAGQAAGAPDGADAAYEPGPAYPFGRPNPDAPERLEEFAFMIGAFECVDERLLPDGSRIRFPATWTARYFMNGHAIQDQYWARGFYTSNIRIYDEAAGEWKVTFFAEPAHSTGTWTGGVEGDSIVLSRTLPTPDGGERVSRLTFHEITDDGFRWRSEVLSEDGAQTNWTSDCTRR